MKDAKDLVLRFLSSDSPRSLAIEITNNCTLKCIHCYHPNHMPRNLDITVILDVVRQFKELGLSHVTLTGGEVFLYPQLKELIIDLKRMNLQIEILSNATLINSEWIKFLEYQGIQTMQISIYSANEITYNLITGTSNMFMKHLASLETLGHSTLDVSCSLIMMRPNFEDRIPMRNMCEQYSNFKIQYGFRILPDRNKKVKIGLEISDEQKIILVNEINYMNALRVEERKQVLVENKDAILNMHPCVAGINCFCMTVDGNIMPCTGYYRVLGNIYSNSVIEILNFYDTLSIKNTFRKDIKKCFECEEIEYCSYCPGIIFNEHGHNLDFEDSYLCKETRVVKNIDDLACP